MATKPETKTETITKLDAKFFRKAKKVNRAIVITDTEAFIPAVADSPEIRVPLPNRRPKTMEERQLALDSRMAEIDAIEAQIEVVRKGLLGRVEAYRNLGTGAADVIIQNQKVKTLMEKRSALARPDTWINEIDGLNLVDIFESKRDKRKLGFEVYSLGFRV